MNEFLIQLQAILDKETSKGNINKSIERIQNQINKLKIQAEIDPKSVLNIKKQLEWIINQPITLTNINIDQNQINKTGQQIGRNIGENINNGLSNGLKNNDKILESFKSSLSNIGMESGTIDAVANRIKNLNVEINSLKQTKNNKGILSVDISGLDKYGQAIKLTEQYNIETGKLIKSIDAVSTAQQKSNSTTDSFINKQKTAVSTLTNQINKLYKEAIDQNTSKPIKSDENLSKLKTQYNEITSAINKMALSSKESFTDENNSVKTLISNFQILVRECKNAETVATSLRSKDISTVKSQYSSKLDILITKMKSSDAYSNGFQKGADNLKSILNNSLDASGLVSFLNGLDKLEAGFKRAQASAKAFNQEQKVEIKTSGLESRLAEIQRISPEINNFKTQIGNADVTIQSLLNDLSKINTNDGFNVVKERVAAFENAAKAAGYAVTEVNLKTESLANQIDKIQLMSFGGIKNDYATQIASLSGNFRSLGLEQDAVNQKLQNVTNTYDSLKVRITQPFDETNYNEIISLNDKLQRELAESENEYKRLQASTKGYVSEQKRLNQANTIEAWNQKNSRATNEVITKNNEYIASLRDLNSQMTNMQFNKIVNGFKQSENAMRGLGKLGSSLKAQMSQAMSSLTTYFSASAAIMKLVSSTRTAVTELKEVDTFITEISKANKELTKTELKQIGNDSFGTASKYGKTATDYLSGVQEASRAGYTNAEEIAELSTAAQGAGDMTAELANQMIIATDKAYKLGGSAEELRNVLDGVNFISNNNAVNMTNLSEGMSIAGSTAASFGIGVNELTSALGTMVASTQQSGSEVARAFKAILLNIRQVSDEEEGIDADGLTKYEQACNSLGVSLKETKNGVLQLRDPMQVLKELSIEYNKLSETDIKRTNLLNSVGGKLRSTQLDALLRQWSMYENMLHQYDEGVGSMAIEAEKTARSWEGSLNRLHNTWVSTVGNVAESNAIITIINGLNNLLSVINNVTDKLGSLGTIGLGAGLFAGFKNTGERVQVYAF
uniref:Phage tail tape measure protein, TP901 family, core region n=1 Tax=Eubacterium plexicaudatum ASF492 TaxID=1235802 RepID=N1ZZY1_9FIRM